MFGYKLLKFATFFLYWLGFAPWLVLILRKEQLINAYNLQDMFLQYTTVLFILIIIYLIIHHVFEYFYLRHKIKKTVRRVTITHQLKRLEKGEIDLNAAQRISTFMKWKEPATPQVRNKVKNSSCDQQGIEDVKTKITKDVSKDLEKEEQNKACKEPEKTKTTTKY